MAAGRLLWSACTTATPWMCPFGSLYYTRETASSEQETEWSKLEDAAKTVIDGLHTELGESLSDLAAAEAYLTDRAEGPRRPVAGRDADRLRGAASRPVAGRAAAAHLRRRAARRGEDLRTDRSAVAGRASEVPRLQDRDCRPRRRLGAVGRGARCWTRRTGADAGDDDAEFLMPLSPHVIIGGAPSPTHTPRGVRVVAGSAALTTSCSGR